MKPIKLPTQLTDIADRLKAVGKHHYFVFTVLLLCSLAAVVYLVDSALRSSTDSSYRDKRLSEILKSDFDKETIQKIENLQKSDEASTAPTTPAPGARTNPFAE